MSSSQYPRGPCVHSGCNQGPGGCAGFVIFVNDTLREYALTADELCSACMHPWFSHRIGSTELAGRSALLLRGGSVGFDCGGFVLPTDGVSPNWDTACACGGPLKAHAILSGSAGQSSNRPTPHVAPSQFVTTHPAYAPAHPPFPSAPPLRIDAATIAATPPLEAYNGLREAETGSTYDRCQASAARARVANQHAGSNAARMRASTSRATVSPLTTSVRPSTSGSTGAPPAPMADATVQIFSVLLIPYQHIGVPGHDVDTTPVTPTGLPFVLMKSSNKKKPEGSKLHSPYDELNCTSFTVKSLLAKKLVTPAYPRPEPEFASYPLLRLAPRRGDLTGDMLRSELWSSDNPGMLDYMAIKAAYKLHPCLPDRVMCIVDKDIVPRCRIECPTDPAPARAITPVAGPSGTRGESGSSSPAPPWSTDVQPLPSPILMGSSVASRSSAAGASQATLQLSGLEEADTIESGSSSPLGSPMDVLIGLPRVVPTASESTASNTPTPATAHVGDAETRSHAPAAHTPLSPPASHVGMPHDRSAHAQWEEEATSVASEAAAHAARREGPLAVEPSVVVESCLVSPAVGAQVEELTGGNMGDQQVAPIHDASLQHVAVESAQEEVGDVETPMSIRPQSSLWQPSRSQCSHDPWGTPPQLTASAQCPTSPLQQAITVQSSTPAPVSTFHDLPGPPAHAVQASRTGDHNGSQAAVTPGEGSSVRRPLEVDEQEGRPTNRRRIDASPVPIYQSPNPRALRPVSDHAVKAWTTRLFSVLAREPDFSEPIPHIRAPNLAMGSHILIFLVRWLIEMRPDPTYWTSALVRQLARVLCDRCFGFAYKHSWAIRGIGRQLAVTTLSGPHPISPIALRYVIEGQDAALALDHTFLRLIDAELYQGLVPWAEYEWGTPLPRSPQHPLIGLISAAGVDCQVFSDPPRHVELEWMERHLVAQAVFDGTELAADPSGLAPFLRGMHLAISEGHTLEETFARNTRDYLATMCSVRLDDVSLLIRHLKIKSSLDRGAIEKQSANSEDMLNATWDVHFEDLFAERLKVYLWGRGHPDHPDVRDVVGEDVFLSDKEDALLRARLFLQMMSGSDLVPPEGDWQLKINVHACFYDCTVTMDEGLRHLLREDPEGILFESPRRPQPQVHPKITPRMREFFAVPESPRRPRMSILHCPAILLLPGHRPLPRTNISLARRSYVVTSVHAMMTPCWPHTSPPVASKVFLVYRLTVNPPAVYATSSPHPGHSSLDTMLVHVRVLTETLEDVERKFEGMYAMPATLEEFRKEWRKEVDELHGEISALFNLVRASASTPGSPNSEVGSEYTMMSSTEDIQPWAVVDRQTSQVSMMRPRLSSAVWTSQCNVLPWTEEELDELRAWRSHRFRTLASMSPPVAPMEDECPEPTVLNEVLQTAHESGVNLWLPSSREGSPNGMAGDWGGPTGNWGAPSPPQDWGPPEPDVIRGMGLVRIDGHTRPSAPRFAVRFEGYSIGSRETPEWDYVDDLLVDWPSMPGDAGGWPASSCPWTLNVYSLPFHTRDAYAELRRIFKFFSAAHPEEDAEWLQDRWDGMIAHGNEQTSMANYVPEEALQSMLNFCHDWLPVSRPPDFLYLLCAVQESPPTSTHPLFPSTSARKQSSTVLCPGPRFALSVAPCPGLATSLPPPVGHPRAILPAAFTMPRKRASAASTSSLVDNSSNLAAAPPSLVDDAAPPQCGRPSARQQRAERRARQAAVREPAASGGRRQATRPSVPRTPSAHQPSTRAEVPAGEPPRGNSGYAGPPLSPTSDDVDGQVFGGPDAGDTDPNGSCSHAGDLAFLHPAMTIPLDSHSQHTTSSAEATDLGRGVNTPLFYESGSELSNLSGDEGSVHSDGSESGQLRESSQQPTREVRVSTEGSSSGVVPESGRPQEPRPQAVHAVQQATQEVRVSSISPRFRLSLTARELLHAPVQILPSASADHDVVMTQAPGPTTADVVTPWRDSSNTASDGDVAMSHGDPRGVDPILAANTHVSTVLSLPILPPHHTMLASMGSFGDPASQPLSMPTGPQPLSLPPYPPMGNWVLPGQPAVAVSALATTAPAFTPTTPPLLALGPIAPHLPSAPMAYNLGLPRPAEPVRKPSGNLMLAHRHAITRTRQSPHHGAITLNGPPSGPSSATSTSGLPGGFPMSLHDRPGPAISRGSSASGTPTSHASSLPADDVENDGEDVVFDEERGTVTGIPPRAIRGRRRGPSAGATPQDNILAFLENRFPSRMAMSREMQARSKHQTGAGYRKNILVRLIVSTFTDLGLGTQQTDVKSREYADSEGWVTVSTNDVVQAFGMAVNTFSTARSHVEICYRVHQWMIDNPRQWDNSDDDGEESRLFEMLKAYCRRGVLPPITSPAASSLTRAERDALLCGSRTLYDSAMEFINRHGGAKGNLQAIPVVYEEET
ncbi:hypothetical protein C8T65DRAFT_695159 [Cerioporus squamosus]|nr:hypothetical protein C8T65DRAFT_695159 [Cerioporus squamosus]